MKKKPENLCRAILTTDEFTTAAPLPESPSTSYPAQVGGVAEWFNAPVLKTDVRQKRTVGSNPTSSAITPKIVADLLDYQLR